MASRGEISIFDRLRIKYGLAINPTPEMVDRWRLNTNKYIADGFGKEVAGRRAASAIFAGFETRLYASEADTIDTLLTEALKK
jgi:hypothetical protein